MFLKNIDIMELLLNDWFDVDMSFSKKLKNAFLWF